MVNKADILLNKQFLRNYLNGSENIYTYESSTYYLSIWFASDPKIIIKRKIIIIPTIVGSNRDYERRFFFLLIPSFLEWQLKVCVKRWNKMLPVIQLIKDLIFFLSGYSCTWTKGKAVLGHKQNDERVFKPFRWSFFIIR